MCFTVLGRAQTRLLSLGWPLAVTMIYATLHGDSGYWTLFSLMVVVGFALDFGVYAWLIHYQPRWLTIALGAVEFLIIMQVVAWAPFLQVRLQPTQALEFYVVAWAGVWVTTQALLPLLWPRWAEDGGEIRYETIVEHSCEARDQPERLVMFGLALMLLLVGVRLGYVARPVIEALSAGGRTTEPLTLMDVAIEHTRHFKGDPRSPVTIIEFSSFQCVACAEYAVAVGYKIDQAYVRTGIVRYGYQHLLGNAPAPPAAEASECADEQGAFWVYSRRLSDRLVADPQREINLDELKQFAAQLQLDTVTFNACLESGRYLVALWSDRNTVNALGITSAPTFLVNGQLITNAISFEAWQQIIEAERQRNR